MPTRRSGRRPALLGRSPEVPSSAARDVRRRHVALGQVRGEGVPSILGAVVHAPATIEGVAVGATQRRAAMGAATAASLLLGLFDVVVVEDGAVEADTAEEHRLVDVLGFGDMEEDAGAC